MAQLAAHEEQVFGRLLSGLQDREDIQLFGIPGPFDATRRMPTVAFRKAGETPGATAARLGERGIAVWSGHYYAIELMTALGLPDGAVRAGVVGYSSNDDVDRLLAAL